MPEGRRMSFGPFALDMQAERLWRGSEEIVLRPKTRSVLHYLVEQNGRLVTKDELLEHVWAGTAVSDAMLKVCVREM